VGGVRHTEPLELGQPARGVDPRQERVRQAVAHERRCSVGIVPVWLFDRGELVKFTERFEEAFTGGPGRRGSGVCALGNNCAVDANADPSAHLRLGLGVLGGGA
jgi:hypothetical protein